MQHALDLLLHPRVPPLVRSLPHVDALSLFRAEESNEEQDVRTGLGIGVVGFLGAAGNEDEVPATTLPVSPSIGRAAEPAAPAAPFTLFAKPTSSSTTIPAFTAPAPVPTPHTHVQPVYPAITSMPMEEDEEDEEMPSIDIGSDSE
ncbi:hypothetical protein EVG20_g1596 [Dentipellis fragilis]|uniref:Uncharacterized protein n=1 Tax=Dentipellis fragilis TaxID=205917 RepID=A0A4Y9ZA42_9AGAM|nr:hypothetical protein EVG20_g1596 [Dentipellis fragilis]